MSESSDLERIREREIRKGEVAQEIENDDKTMNDNSHTVLTCVYCGQEYPDGTPAWGSQVLTDHIRVCEKHPMRKLASDNKTLRAALVGLVGADTKSELEAMETAIRCLPVPDVDRMNTINAIQALIQTCHDHAE